MTKKEEFKLFIKSHPELVSHVSSGKTTWQNLFEIYDIYGEDKNAWKEYFTDSKMPEIFNTFKNINLDEVKEGIDNFQKILGMLGGLKTTESTYKPRPIYKHFDD